MYQKSMGMRNTDPPAWSPPAEGMKEDQIVIFPRNVPKTARITSEISPSVA